MENQKITKDMLIIDIINKYEKTIPVFMAFGMGCVGCLAARGENVEQAAAVHGIDVDFLIEKLNEVAK